MEVTEEQEMAREAWGRRRRRWTAGERLGFARGGNWRCRTAALGGKSNGERAPASGRGVELSG
jgi:hypothetical protein